RLGNAADLRVGRDGGDGGLQRGARRLHEAPVGGDVAHVDGDGGVHHPAVDVDADVELGEVPLRVARLLRRGGTVMGGDVVARGLDGKGAAGAAAGDVLFDGHADVAH